MVAQARTGGLLTTDEATPGKPTRLGELLDQWETARTKNQKLRPCTHQGDARAVKAMKAAMGSTPLYALNDRTIAAYVERRLQTVAPATVEADIRKLKTALKWAAERGFWCGQTPHSLTEDLEYGETEPRRALSFEEVEALRAVITNPSWRLAFEICVDAGLRIGEVISRRWEHWDRHRKMLRVCAVPLINFKPKGKRARTVPLTDSLNDLLLDAWMRAGQPKEGWILRTYTGERYVTRTPMFSMYMGEACEAAGVDRVPVHSLRHTYGSRLLEAGVDILTVSRILGHASSAITEQVYLHILSHQLTAAAGKLEALQTRSREANSGCRAAATAQPGTV